MIVGVNKCNITALAVEQLNSLYYGFQCKDKSVVILENYLDYLNCPTVDHTTCFPDNCSNPVITNMCNIVLSSISYTVVGRTLTFYIDPANLTGATLPLTYLWSYNTQDFTITGNNTSSTLVLTLKTGKVLSSLVTMVTVGIQDANQCTASKQCYLVQGTMHCDSGYVQCPNGSNLVVTSNPLESFNIEANGVTSINAGAFTVTSGVSSFIVDWGDGTKDTFAAGARNPTHTYDSPYTGFIKITATDLTDITLLGLSGDFSSTIQPTDTLLTIRGSEIAKLDGLLTLGLGNNAFFDGTTLNLPRSLAIITITYTNISGDVLDLPRSAILISIQGTNTISGSTAQVPTTTTYFLLYGNNTMSGSVANLQNTMTIFLVDGSNTISGTAIQLPRSLTTVQIRGFTTLGGDVAGFPPNLTSINITGNTTLFGNISNLPSGLTGITLLGVNTLSGTLSNMPSGMIFFQILGHNALTGDLALIPATIQFISINSTNAAITPYTPGLRTWSNTMDSVVLVPGVAGLNTTMIDNLLIELDAQVVTWVNIRVITLLGVNGTRSAASNAAVTGLTGKGVTLNLH